MVRQQIFAAADWDPVTPGSLNGLASRIRSRRRRRIVAKVLVPVAAIILFASLLPFLANSSTDSQSNYGGIACSEVRSNLNSFIAKDLDQERMGAIAAHLRECRQCRQRMEAMLRTEVVSSDKTFLDFCALSSLDHSPVLAASIR